VTKKSSADDAPARALVQATTSADLVGLYAVLAPVEGRAATYSLATARALLALLADPDFAVGLELKPLPVRERVRVFVARHGALLETLGLEALVDRVRRLRVEPYRGRAHAEPNADFAVLAGALLPFTRPARRKVVAPVVVGRAVAAQVELDALLRLFRRWGFLSFRKAAKADVPTLADLFAPFETALPTEGRAWGRALMLAGALTMQPEKARLVLLPEVLAEPDLPGALRAIMRSLWRTPAQALALDISVLGVDAWRVSGCVERPAPPTAHRDLLLAGLRRLPVGEWVEFAELAGLLYQDGLLTPVAESLRQAWFDQHGVRVKHFRPDTEDGEPFRLRVPSLLGWSVLVAGRFGLVDLAYDPDGAGAVRRASPRSTISCEPALAALTHLRLTSLGSELLDPFIGVQPSATSGPGEAGLDALTDLLTRT
jgi:hypothetical protein